MERPESETFPRGETLISKITPLLGTTPSENTEIQHRNTPEDISDILGTTVYKTYMGHSIADIRWHNHKPAEMFLTTC